MNVLVVESPAKAKTINKYLGPNYRVLASFGHIRDLPSKDGSVKPDDDFAMIWEVDPRAQKRIKEIADAVKGADKLILATDPDREGEAISWHVLEVLKQKHALGHTHVERVVFNAITRSAVLDAIAHPRAIHEELVDAYLARRALDYLVGFSLSPVLWRKLPGARSAGRVQSVALQAGLRARDGNRAVQGAGILDGRCRPSRADGGTFSAHLTHLDGKKLDKMGLANEADAARAVEAIKARKFTVGNVETKPVKRNPAPPFITSTLQQEASRKLGFAAKRTMQVAQQLYEGVEVGGETAGLITYMRTDGVQMAAKPSPKRARRSANAMARAMCRALPRIYTSKAKNAQEAHEAIRPTCLRAHARQDCPQSRPGPGRLYELIWKRALASQMESAELERTSVDAVSDDAKVTLRANGHSDTVRRLPHALPGRQGRRERRGRRHSCPKVARGDALGSAKRSRPTSISPSRRRAIRKPASCASWRSSASAVRPPTPRSCRPCATAPMCAWTATASFPRTRAASSPPFSTNFFRRYVEYGFTADLEEKLDEVSAGELGWKKLLRISGRISRRPSTRRRNSRPRR